MVDAGDRLTWSNEVVLDKHSVGGLPGNRTTPIVVAVVASHGLTMPKTSSRAITSPAGTADTMETLAPVDLDLPAIRRVVEREYGCVVWGGAVRLSPADDILIRVERALDIDSEGQLVASVLSKKIAAGSTHLVLDVPVGPTAKVRRRGIGPALEAKDVLAVLQQGPDAPADLQKRACRLAGALLEFGGRAGQGLGCALAAQALHSGRAWDKFQRICEAQGGMRTPPEAGQRRPLPAPVSGRVASIDNRKIARLAKLAGAPEAKAAGVEMHVKLGDVVARGQPICTLHAETPGELQYALEYAASTEDIVEVEP